MALAAIAVGWYMIRRRCFTSGRCAIVTSRAAIYYACVIEPGASKSNSVMTYRAIFGGRKMAVILDRCYCARAIVAGCTVIHDTGMIEYRIHKGAGYMTD